MRAMSESFVDLTYRGLALGRRVKLTQVRPSTGYVELAAPMPVGTAIGIATDEGVMLEATVAEVHEQVGGSERTPGMVVRPKLDADAQKSWWKERVALPDVVKSEPAPAVGIVRSKRKSENAIPELMDDGRNTAVMEAAKETPTVPDNIIEERRELPTVPDNVVAEARRVTKPGIAAQREGRDSTPPHDRLVRDAPPDTQIVEVPPSEINIIDDGKRTIAMSSVDLEALGLDPSSSSSGQMSAADDDDDGNGNGAGESKPGDSKSGGRRKRKRR
jgi:hypothetical protein